MGFDFEDAPTFDTCFRALQGAGWRSESAYADRRGREAGFGLAVGAYRLGATVAAVPADRLYGLTFDVFGPEPPAAGDDEAIRARIGVVLTKVRPGWADAWAEAIGNVRPAPDDLGLGLRTVGRATTLDGWEIVVLTFGAVRVGPLDAHQLICVQRPGGLVQATRGQAQAAGTP